MKIQHCLSALLLVAGCGGTSTPDDAASTPDDGPTLDAFVANYAATLRDAALDAFVPSTDTGVDAFVSIDAGTDASSTADAGSCGTARPTVPTAGTEGLVIARDGTIYYSISGGVARVRTDGTNEPMWLRIAGATTIWGLALDASNTHLFICEPAGRVRVATNLTTTPTQTMLATVAQPNGITVGPDGAVYVSSFSDDSVLRLDATTGAATTVTASPISQADGVAFTDDGHLLVTSYMDGTVLSLALDAAHHETGRTTVATMVPNADGVAVDATGTVWAAGGNHVWRIGAGAVPDMTTTIHAGAANLEWGSGVLGCQDLYVATGSGLTRLVTSVEQRAVPWH
jgi:WD40 repeat protein